MPRVVIVGAGHAGGRLEVRVLRGMPARDNFAVFHLVGSRILAAEAVNAVPEFMVGKQLIASRRPVSPSRLVDVNVSMKEIARRD